MTGEDPEQVPNSYKQALRGLEGPVAEHVGDLRGALEKAHRQLGEHVWQSEAATAWAEELSGRRAALHRVADACATDLTSAIGAEPDEVAPGDRRARWYAWRHHVPEAF